MSPIERMVEVTAELAATLQEAVDTGRSFELIDEIVAACQRASDEVAVLARCVRQAE
ncbi:hypothetical protein APY04_1858 [Hyphomicrobium sulfonivorans]|uniref:Uncharacterized protein n=1 Tax=Hyphomicrobium sulfonivorans TaxID=121290 RepID=A0A125NUR9_HYPSL|nr:hypothetical protein [Hyphomicrobium sulfonivorans]KWT67499.1 hypothetical protein APY04_1858 [Hyphomicrobium sulfonivorans]